jgi:hypothetical protein
MKSLDEEYMRCKAWLLKSGSEVAAKLGNVKVFKWALWNEYFHEEYWDDMYS